MHTYKCVRICTHSGPLLSCIDAYARAHTERTRRSRRACVGVKACLCGRERCRQINTHRACNIPPGSLVPRVLLRAQNSPAAATTTTPTTPTTTTTTTPSAAAAAKAAAAAAKAAAAAAAHTLDADAVGICGENPARAQPGQGCPTGSRQRGDARGAGGVRGLCR